MDDRKNFGQTGEELATDFLKEKGYEILERNWRFRHIEVDIIARHKQILVFVEVKTRKGADWGEPYTAVDERKQRTLIYAAERYLFGHGLDLEVRFDIVSIISNPGRTALEHIEGAFRAVAR